MTYVRKTINPIDFVLTTRYGLGKSACKKLKNEIQSECLTWDSNRGHLRYCQEVLEKRYPGFSDHFPLKNHPQKKAKPGGGYMDVFADYAYEDALIAYGKNISRYVATHNAKATKKMNKTLETQLNLDPFMETPAPTQENYTETINGLLALARQGAKSCKTPDGWEVQF